MKKMLFIAMLFVFIEILHAQNDVTQFLGIPVDGTKSEMIQKLKAKGFRSSEIDKDVLEGEFNGYAVYVHIATNNNKVYRICLVDQIFINEAAIKRRFNKLCEQFSNNSKYISLRDYTIPEKENIRHEMIISNKRYEAIYYQRPVIQYDSRPVWFMINGEYGEYGIIMFYDNEYNNAQGEDL